MGNMEADNSQVGCENLGSQPFKDFTEGHGSEITLQAVYTWTDSQHQKMRD